MRHTVFSMFASVVLVSGCTARIAPQDQGSQDPEGPPNEPLPPPDVDASAPDAPDAGPTTATCGSAFSMAPTVADTCGQGCGFPPGHPHAIAAMAAFQSMFARRWVSCGQPSITGRTDEAGFVAHADGTYTILVYDGAHNLVPDPAAGTYTIESFSALGHQVSFGTAAGPGGILPTSGTITDSPRMLLLSADGSDFHYVPADDTDWPDDGHGVCSGGTYVPPARCNDPQGNAKPVASQAEFATLLSKRWVLCSPNGIGKVEPMRAGLDVRSDGSFTVLAVDAANNLVRATNVYDQGIFTIEPLTPSANDFDVSFVVPMGSWGVAASFTDRGELILNDNGVFGYRYVPLDVPCGR